MIRAVVVIKLLIVHITEMMPNTNNDANIFREWMKVAQSLGF